MSPTGSNLNQWNEESIMKYSDLEMDKMRSSQLQSRLYHFHKMQRIWRWWNFMVGPPKDMVRLRIRYLGRAERRPWKGRFSFGTDSIRVDGACPKRYVVLL